jgi:hypothetical protein
MKKKNNIEIFYLETLEDEGDQNETDGEEKNDLRISQPKYSQLLKDLDFSRTRMVNVKNVHIP